MNATKKIKTAEWFSKTAKYVAIDTAQIPAKVRFDIPRRHQGQIIEVAYGDFGRSEADHGSPYKRVTDTSIFPAEVSYYHWVEA